MATLKQELYKTIVETLNEIDFDSLSDEQIAVCVVDDIACNIQKAVIAVLREQPVKAWYFEFADTTKGISLQRDSDLHKNWVPLISLPKEL